MKFLVTWKEAFWLSFTLTIILIIPVGITQYSFLVDYSSTGQIGDTIGGVTTPFIGLVSAFLVYKAFLMQYNANKMLSVEKALAIIQYNLDYLKATYNKKIIDHSIKLTKRRFEAPSDTNEERVDALDNLLKNCRTPLYISVYTGKILLENKFNLDKQELLNYKLHYVTISGDLSVQCEKVLELLAESPVGVNWSDFTIGSKEGMERFTKIFTKILIDVDIPRMFVET